MASLKRALVAITVLIGIASTAANADHGKIYHWARTSNPFTLITQEHLSEPWKTHLKAAASAWNTSSVLDLSILFIPPKQQSCRVQTGVIVVCNGAFGRNGVWGSAQIWVKGVHITQAVVRLNDTYMFSGESGTTSWRQYLMCQELGHAFGLNHQDENNFNTSLKTCMDYQATLMHSEEEKPNEHDYEELEKIYAHLDATTTVAGSGTKSSSAFPRNGDVTHPSQWGKLMHESRDGRHARYELDLGNDEKLVTHAVRGR
ncbi:MAG: hypothetical protein ACKVQT_04525 [Burkholderiales bacterium]